MDNDESTFENFAKCLELVDRPRIGTMAADLVTFAAGRQFGTVLVDPPWRFANRTGKMAPEHKRLSRYVTLSMEEIAALPVGSIVAPTAHLYLWVPNALLPFGLQIMEAWGFEYKTNMIWHKLRKDGGSDGRGVGFYFRNVTENDSVWRSREERADIGARASAGKLYRNPQARTQPKAG